MPNWLLKNCHFLKIPFLYYFSMSQITRHFQMSAQSAVTIILMKVAHKKLQFNLSLNFFVSIFTLDWLRLNCTEIFHYLTNQLKGTPIFENDHMKIDINKESSTVFDDFDFQPRELLSSSHSNTVFVATSNSRQGIYGKSL